MRCVFAEVMPRRIVSAIADAVRRGIVHEASSLRDAVRAADLPLPIAAVAASICTLVIAVTSRGAP
jgi:hypothetical protein